MYRNYVPDNYARVPTQVIKVPEGHVGRSVVDKLSSGEKSEGVKQLEDGVAWLVDGEDDHTV